MGGGWPEEGGERSEGRLGLWVWGRRTEGSFGTTVESRIVSLSGRTHEKKRKEDEWIKET